EAKYMAEDASSKKFLVSNFTNYKMTDSRPVLEQYNELLDFKHTLKHKKEKLTLVELGSHMCIEESLRVQDNDKPKGNMLLVLQLSIWWNITTPPDTMTTRVSVNIMITQGLILTRRLNLLVGNVAKLVTLKGIKKVLMLETKPMDDDVTWWVDSGATVHVCKDRYLRFSSGKIVSLFNVLHVRNIRKNLVSSTFMSASKLNDSILWHVRLCHVHFKRMQDMSKDGLIVAFDIDTEKCKTSMLTKITKKPFHNVKCETEVLDLIYSDLCDLHDTPSLGNEKYFVRFIDDASRTDRGGEYMDTLYFQSVGIIHETAAPYTPQQNGISERKNKILKEIVNSMLSYSGLSQGFWGEAMLTACHLLNRAVVRLPDPKLKTVSKRGIECIFIGYDEHSKAFRFYVIEPNESVSINSIIESRDAIFDENRFSLVPRPNLRIPNETEEVVQHPEPELRKSKRNRTPKNFGLEFQLYLIEGTRGEVSDKHSYCFNIEDDPKTFNEVNKSQDVAFWKEAINDEMDSIMSNNTWVLVDLPLGCKWIFKRKLKVDGTIKKFKARLVIQGFRQKPGIDYFDTYALVARISTIRLPIAMASIHNQIIHQIDVKTAFLNGELEEGVYMNQP
ncbi:zinc finger, CCHC-type containing protein, partial [Tanacetum coccineum]